MDASRCPFLGMSDDPDTRLDFPSQGNVCYKAAPPGPIQLDYQQHTCLTEQHARCPIFTADQAIPVPATLLAPAPRANFTSRALPVGRLPLALALVVVLGLVLFFGANALGNRQNIAGSGSSAQDPNRPGVFSLPRTGATQQSATPDPTEAQRRTACPPPDNWVSYTVNPTDSLYRLSVLHAIPVAELQQANCMGNETVILPGQVIFIPFTPTRTPSVTITSTRFIPARTATADPDENITVPEVPATDAPPTQAAPTTAVPPTAVVPTIAPTIAPTVAPTIAPTIIPPILPTLFPTLLPPILPTAEPTETQAPPPESGGGNNNKRTETIECGGSPVTVDGNNNNITLTGVCPGLIVTGNNNTITVPPGTPVLNMGRNNEINEG